MHDDLDYRMAVEAGKAKDELKSGGKTYQEMKLTETSSVKMPKTRADVMKNVPRRDAIDSARFAPGQRFNNVDLYLHDIAGLE